MKFILLLLTALFSLTSQAQRFNWSTSAGYPGINNSYYGTVDLATDSDGNVYVVDNANLPQVSQGDTFLINGIGTAMFIYKFNSSGELIWGNSYGTNAGVVTPLNLEMGSDGNLYALAHINGTSDIYTSTDTFDVPGPTNVILSISPTGTLNWAEPIGYSCPACMMLEIANDRIYYQAGNALIKSMEFDQSPDASYNFYFEPGTAISAIPIQGSAVFSNGDILLAGLQRGNASFIAGDTLEQIGTPFLYCNISYVRLTADLQPVWANTFGGLHDPETHFIPTEIDENNQIYTGWEVLDTISIAETTVIGEFNNYAGSILSMDSNGNPLWLRELQSSAALRINYLFADEETNKVWLTGISSSPTTIGDSIITPGVNGSPILASLNSAGEFSNQMALIQMPGGSQGKTLGKATTGQLYMGGNLNGGSDYEINCIDYQGNKGLYISSFLDLPTNPPTPSISNDGPSLTATPPFEGNIQWYLNGEAIPDATNQTHQATAIGNYAVVYSYDFGCIGADTSSVFFVETGINKLNTLAVDVYPNPTTNILNITLPESGEIAVNIWSGTGQLMKQFTTFNREIQTHELAEGLYFLQIEHQRKIYQQRFLKTK
jgi:hypothetical protein